MIQNAQAWARRQLAPVNVGIMVALAVASVLFWFSHGKGLESFDFLSDWTSRPWTILTYPFAYIGVGGVYQLIFAVFVLMWMNLTCSSVERTIGTPKYAGLWVFMTVVPALFYWLGGQLLRQPVALAGPFMPVAAVSFIWALNNKRFSVNLYGLIPVSGTLIAILIVLGVVFGYGFRAPLLGVFAGLHLIPAYFYAENKIPFFLYEVRGYQKYKPSKAQKDKDAKYFDEVKKRQQEREEKERLRKLFETSIRDEDK